MVREEEYRSKLSYVCEACKLHYVDEADAKRCEDWCRENPSCSLELTLNSLERKEKRREVPDEKSD